MISIPFTYPLDPNLKLEVKFSHWFSPQKDFTLWANGEKLESSEELPDIFVAKAQDKLYAIRYEADFFTPKLYIEKEPFFVGEPPAWYDFANALWLFISMMAFLQVTYKSFSALGWVSAPVLFGVVRYISLSKNQWKRWAIFSPSLLIAIYISVVKHWPLSLN